MKQIRNMSQVEPAAYIQDRLHEEHILVVLSGGTAATFYSNNKYLSKDLDLINTHFAKEARFGTFSRKLVFMRRGVTFCTPQRHTLSNFLMGLFLLVRSL